LVERRMDELVRWNGKSDSGQSDYR
jgi:hypothetical protein